MPLDEDLLDVGHQPTRVPKRVLLVDPLLDDLGVGFIVLDSAQVARAEHFGSGFDDQVLVRQKPLVIDKGQFLDFLDCAVVENDGCTGAVKRQDGVQLVAEFRAD